MPIVLKYMQPIIVEKKLYELFFNNCKGAFFFNNQDNIYKVKLAYPKYVVIISDSIKFVRIKR